MPSKELDALKRAIDTHGKVLATPRVTPETVAEQEPEPPPRRG